MPFVPSAQEAGGITHSKALPVPAGYTGKVVDQEGRPLAGVAVFVDEATGGTTTDHDGYFTIKVRNMEDTVLQFRFIGMKPVSLRVKDKPATGDWIITMVSDPLELDEVIVTGYSTLPRRETASAVTQINAREILLGSESTLDRMLAGQIPGMTVVQSSGEVGSTPQMRIRGTSTLTSGKSPLWVLDGVILNDAVEVDHTQINSDDAVYLIGNAIAGINPQDIETITVLKDASATAIYGVQAANGVIVITTRQGEEGKMRISYNTSVTLSQRPSYRDFDRMNAAERIRISQEIIDAEIPYGRIPVGLGYEGLYMDYQNGRLSYDEFGAAVRRMADRNMDWYDILFRSAVSHRHTLNMSGGGNGTRYYGSLGYDRENGTARQNSGERYTVLMKTQSRISERLHIGLQLNGSRNDNKGYHSSVNPNTYAYRTARTIQAYDDAGGLFFYDTRQRMLSSALNGPREELLYNILNESGVTGQDGRVSALAGKAELNWKIWKGLEYDLLASYAHQEAKTNEWARAGSNYVSLIRGYNEGSLVPGSAAEDKSPLPYGGVVRKVEQQQRSRTLRNKLGYTGHLGADHVLSLAVISEIRSIRTEGFSGTWYGWMPDQGNSFSPMLTTGYLNILSSLAPTTTNKVFNTVSWLGYAVYSWKDKIALNSNVRMDGSNQFGENPRYRFLPIWSLSAKYTLTQERFLADNPVISYLAVRGSYGIQGNVDKDTSPDLVVRVGDYDPQTGMNQSYFEYLPNKDLRWEKTTSYNLGVEFGLLDNRIRGSVDFYSKRGVDMIMSKAVSQTTGQQYVKINAGKVNNRGLEMGLVFEPVRSQDFNLTVGLTWSYNRSELISANNNTAANAEMLSGTALIEGKPLGTFYSYRFAGLDPTTGYPVFYDKEGKDYTVIDGERSPNYALYTSEMELVESGQISPASSGGINLGFHYRNLRLDMGLTYILGGHARLPALYGNDYSSVFDPLVNLPSALSGRWRKPGDERHTHYPALYDSDYYATINKRPNIISDPLIEGNRMYDLSDARVVRTDNIRLRNIAVTYYLPVKLTGKPGIEAMSVRLEATNLFIIASQKWRGQDPESGYSNAPIPRNYTLGVSIHF